MKRIVGLLLVVLLIAGCSTSENVGPLAKEMQQQVDQVNDSESTFMEMLGVHNEVIDEIKEMKEPDQTKLSELSKNVEISKKELTTYEDKMKKVQATLSDLKAKAEAIGNENTKKLAVAFVDHFSKMMEANMKYINVSKKVLESDKKSITDFQAGKKSVENQSLEIEMNKINAEFNDKVEKFNQSWEEFNKVVMGQAVQ